MIAESTTENNDLENQDVIKRLAFFKAALDEHAIVAITDKRGKITYANDKFCVVSKYPRDELIGKDHRIINSGYHSKEFFHNLWNTIKNGHVWKGEIKNRAKDGSHYWVNTTIVPFLDNAGNPVQYIAIRAEITQQKALEERNIEIMKNLEAANQDLKDFAYIVSHDLKAPLRGISSLANWLIDDYSEKLGAEGKEQLGLIASRVVRLGKMVDGILAYSRAGRHLEDRLKVNLDDVVRNVIELLAPPSHITIQIVSPLPQVVMEYYKAQQVFQNLLSNAIKFMDKPTGHISISCIRVESCWRFTIADNGPGIEAKYCDKIFDLFQTLNRRDAVESTGIGLSLIKKIIDLESGKVWVESTVGEGTSFHFTLPYVAQD